MRWLEAVVLRSEIDSPTILGAIGNFEEIAQKRQKLGKASVEKKNSIARVHHKALAAHSCLRYTKHKFVRQHCHFSMLHERRAKVAHPVQLQLTNTTISCVYLSGTGI